MNAEKVKGIDIVDSDDGFPTIRLERICSVQGRMYYLLKTERAELEFYVTRKGFLRVVS